MGKSLKWNSHRSTAFGSGKSSFCWNKDKLCQIAFAHPILGMKQITMKRHGVQFAEPLRAWRWVMQFACVILTANLPNFPQFTDGETEIQLYQETFSVVGFSSNHMPVAIFFQWCKMKCWVSQLHPALIPSFSFFLFRKYSGSSKWWFNSILSYFLHMLSDTFPWDYELHQGGIVSPVCVVSQTCSACPMKGFGKCLLSECMDEWTNERGPCSIFGTCRYLIHKIMNEAQEYWHGLGKLKKNLTLKELNLLKWL